MNRPFNIPDGSRMDYLAPAEISIIQELIDNYALEGQPYSNPYRLIYIMAEHINLLEEYINLMENARDEK